MHFPPSLRSFVRARQRTRRRPHLVVSQLHFALCRVLIHPIVHSAPSSTPHHRPLRAIVHSAPSSTPRPRPASQPCGVPHRSSTPASSLMGSRVCPSSLREFRIKALHSHSAAPLAGRHPHTCIPVHARRPSHPAPSVQAAPFQAAPSKTTSS